MEYWLAGAVVWVMCGFLSYGMVLAYFQRRWPTLADEERDKDRRFALLCALTGPINLMVCIITYRGYGFMWRLPPRKEG